MTPMVEGWTDEEFCREFWASLDEFYGRWKEASGGSLRDFEAAFERGKKNGIQPHPFFAKLGDEKVSELSFPKARRTMAKALRDDESLRIGYVSNVAMLLHDRYGITDHETRNRAAEEILELIFEKG
jgi:hypothetical protein